MPVSKKQFGARLLSDVLTIDPGLSGTGLAFWNEAEWNELVYPRKALNIYARENSTWDVRANTLAAKFHSELELMHHGNHKTVRAAIEYPSVFSDTARSQASAKKGDMGKLFVIVGMYMEILRQWSIPVQLVPVNDWIGQLPKEVNQRRILERLPRLGVVAHALDATGLGLHLKGFLNNG